MFNAFLNQQNRIGRTRFSVVLKTSFICFLMMITACKSKHGGSEPEPDYPTEPTSFTYSPIEVSKISYLLSLGWLQPVGHTLPTDHVYFHFNATYANPLPVYAPGGGKIWNVLYVPVTNVPEVKVWVQMNKDFGYYLDHIVLDPSLKQGSIIKAGDKIGTTGYGGSIDLGAIDNTVNVPFVNPARYVSQTLHCGKPFQYFTSAIQSQLYPLVDRQGTEKDGWVCTDVADHLSGNWFYDNGKFYTDGPDGWDKELSFAYDIQRPSTVMVSCGGVMPVGKWSLAATAIKPANVSPANGKVAYQLLLIDPNYPNNPPTIYGLMLVQMTDNTHLKTEIFPGSTATDGVFTGNAKMYVR